MTYKEVFVHSDSTERSDNRLQIAFDLARRFGANAKGLYCECDPYFSNIPAPNLFELFSGSAARSEARFNELSAQAGVSALWRLLVLRKDTELTRTVTLGASHCDLAVLGQHNPNETKTGVPADLVEQVVLNAGRPVLVLPFAGEVNGLGRRIMIGWNAGREAVRAVHDSLPFLQSSEETTLFAVNPSQEKRGAGVVSGVDMAKHLEAHGVNARTDTRVVEGMSPMETLMFHASERDVDLLIVGAYGHYGFPDLLRGSGTKHLLKHMTVPVLMSH